MTIPSDFVTWQGLQEALLEAINSLPPMWRS